MSWNQELAGLRREIVDVLEDAVQRRGLSRWALRSHALAMWRQLDVAEANMRQRAARAVEEWLVDPR